MVSDTLRLQYEAVILPQREALYRAARWHTNNPAEAEDLVQDVMLLALERMGAYRHSGTPLAWLRAMLWNACRDRWKRRRVERRRVLRLAADCRVGRGMPGSCRSAEEETFTRFDVDAVRCALEGLPPCYRETIRLYAVDGMSYEEIARDTGLSLGTIRSRINRGRRRLLRHQQVTQMA